MKLFAYVPDLMDRSRFAAVDLEKTFVKTAAELAQAEESDIVVADLARSDALPVLTDLNGPRLVAFASHVDAELIAQAKALGIEVYARSRFFSQLVRILAQGDH